MAGLSILVAGSSAWFWVVMAGLAAVFLFAVRIRMPLLDKIRAASWWSAIAPAILVGFAAYHEQYGVSTSIVFYVGITAFFVCMDASLTLLFKPSSGRD